jgi:hypothetical protein
MLPIQACSVRREGRQYQPFHNRDRGILIPASTELSTPEQGKHHCQEGPVTFGNIKCQCNPPNGPWACCRNDGKLANTQCALDAAGACRCHYSG